MTEAQPPGEKVIHTGTLFIAPPGRGSKKEPLFRQILSSCAGNDYSRVLYIGPNSFVLSAAKALFYAFLKKTGSCPAYIPFQSGTIRQFLSRIYEDSGDKNPISGHARTLMIHEVLGGNNIGFARILSELFSKARHYIPDKELWEIQEAVRALIFDEQTAERAVKAFTLLQKYEQELKSKNLLDPDELLLTGLPFIREQVFPPVLVIDGFYDPTRLETEILGALALNAEKVFVLAEEGTEILDYIRSLPLEIALVKTEGPSPRNKTGYYAFPSMEEEVEGIARSIGKLIIEGIKPWEVTLSFPLLSKYLPVTRRVFRRHGIPLDREEYPVSGTGPFLALEDLITCIEEDYPRCDFLSLLMSPFFPAIPAEVREKALSYSYKAGIVKGREAWQSIGDILVKSRHDDINEMETEQIAYFQQGLSNVIDIIERLKKFRSLPPFIDALEESLNSLGFFDSPAGLQEDLVELIAAQLDELRKFAGLYGPSGRCAASPVFYLRYMMQDMKASDGNSSGVKLLPLELAGGLDTRAIFFGGMLEGDFPSRPDIDPVLPEKVKKALGMPHLEYYLKRQKAYYRRLLNVSLHDPWFSCPTAEGDKVFLASPFLEWGKTLSLPELNIFTEEDVQLQQGEVLQSRSESQRPREERMFPDKPSRSALTRRMKAQFKGFLSITSIEYYRKCPLRFYVEKVLGLDVDAPPQFEVQSRLWGTLAHKTMEHLFKDGDIDLDDMEKKMFQGLDESLRQFPIGDFWSRVAVEIFRKLLPSLQEQEAGIRKEGFSPAVVEKSISAEIGGVIVKGKLDRADRKRESADEGLQTEGSPFGDRVILLDYKTGAVDRDSLQLPLYACLWMKNFPGNVEKTGYYSLKEGRVDWFPKKSGMDEYLSSALSTAEEIVKNIQQGAFPALPVKENECRYCFHRPLCRR